MNIKRFCALFLTLALTACLFCGCGSKKDTVLIYTASTDYEIEDMQKHLGERFPELDIDIQFLSTGDLAAKLSVEGKNADCDIVYAVEYPYLENLDKSNLFADVSGFVDLSVFSDDTRLSNSFLPQCRNGGAIIVDKEALKEKGLAVPTCYQDLLDPKYKNLISMPNPKSSGTGYMFLLSLINAWGEDKAFDYFDKLSENIFQFTTSGSGPINALLQGEAAIALGMTSQAVLKIKEVEAPFEILFFEEGSPFSLYGSAIIDGKNEKEGVNDVFVYLSEEYAEHFCSTFYPEKIFKDKTFEVEGYPTDIKYADMSNNTAEEKERLLEKWKY